MAFDDIIVFPCGSEKKTFYEVANFGALLPPTSVLSSGQALNPCLKSWPFMSTGSAVRQPSLSKKKEKYLSLIH